MNIQAFLVRISLTLSVLLMSFSFQGCSYDCSCGDDTTSTETTSVKEKEITAADLDIYKFVDPDNGVEYWVYQNRVTGQGGICLRVNPDNTPYVNGEDDGR